MATIAWGLVKVLKKIFCLVALAALALASGPLSAQAPPLVNGIDANYPPFAFIDDTGVAKGFDIDMVNWIAEKKGLNVVHQAFEWDSIVTNLRNNKLDLIASGLSVTAERAEQVAFSEPYWRIKQVVIVRQDSPLTLEQVLSSGKRIGAQSGTSDFAAMTDSNGKDGRDYVLVAFSSAELAKQDVINGRIDAAVMNDEKAAEYLGVDPVKILGLAGIPDEDYAIAVNKDNAELLRVINEGLAEIQADPFWQELLEKHGLRLIKF
jgi:polar amino acid transport system substrate-binding protein